MQELTQGERSHEERKAMLKQDLVGKFITAKYQDVTPDGKLHFASGLGIRRVSTHDW